MEKNNIEVVSGDGSNLDISPVYENISAGKPNTKKPSNVIIPRENNNYKKINKKNKKK